jgi:hypothetical protein
MRLPGNGPALCSYLAASSRVHEQDGVCFQFILRSSLIKKFGFFAPIHPVGRTAGCTTAHRPIDCLAPGRLYAGADHPANCHVTLCYWASLKTTHLLCRHVRGVCSGNNNAHGRSRFPCLVTVTLICESSPSADIL